MKYRIISVGKIREKFYKAGVDEYLKRLNSYIKIEIIEGLEEKIKPKAGKSQIDWVKEKEAQKVLKIIGDDEIIIACDGQGKSLTSEDLAGLINSWNISGKYRVNLIIGGPHGLSPEIIKRADITIAFSLMTFPHQMAALILTEQLYRGFKIIKGEPYHK